MNRTLIAGANGQGIAAAEVLRVKADGSQIYEDIVRFDAAQSKFVPIPIDLGSESDQVYLVLYGTGIRFRSSLSGVTAKIGGSDSQVTYAGAVQDYFGLDQVNVRLSRTLIGRGMADVTLTVNGITANTVTVSIK